MNGLRIGEKSSLRFNKNEKKFKQNIFPMFLAFLFPIAAFAQEEIRLSDINKPGDMGIVEKIGIVLAENLFGPHKVAFSGNSPGNFVPVLSREEIGPSGGKSTFDNLTVLFSGRIYSPNMAEPVIFENKTPEEIVLLEIPVFPAILEQPFTLYLDLKIQTMSKSTMDKLSNDAGKYSAVLTINWAKI